MLRTVLAPLLLAALLLAAGLPAVRAAAPEPATSAGIKSLLDGEGELRLAGRTLDRGLLEQLYTARQDEPIWNAERQAALQKAIASAALQGIDPAMFAVPKAAPDRRELLLTDAFLRYAGVLAHGLVNSATLETDWSLPVPLFDPAAAFDAAAEGDPARVLARLAPPEAAYQGLVAALAQYRAMAAAGGWKRLPETGKLKLGDSGPAVERLRRRLAAEGYLPPDAAAGADFDDALDAAVRRFQALHGIAVDGTVWHATYVALNVPVSARIEQIRDNLERWRETPHRWPSSRIEVNVPAAWLTVIAHDEPGLTMRAIVGAAEHPTPVLRAWMSAVLFNPPWRIPDSIARKEILPKAKRDPHYLARNHYVYVGAPGRSALQQLPGPDNALGRIKFEVPNIYDVYLHDTPSHPLFGRVLRDLSHGCVRLEDPRDLAVYVLSDGKTAWTLQDIDGAIAEGDTRRVPLAHGIPVYLLYWTAFVDTDGSVEFRDDVYGRDDRLAAAVQVRDAEERLGIAPPAPLPVPHLLPSPPHPTKTAAK